ncbi:MAG TPA: 16S rRNA (uracil(1498)-N(3))-methyltransferase [Gallionellaceae bacterium]|nr:16S rRNA (uracil(1498)-N(3))-methyltransferase [Gallionellaceae bacterium]
MSAPRFYCPATLPSSGLFELPADAAHHAHRVLRLRVNDPVQIFDGEGKACDATISSISGKHVDINITRTCPAQAPSPLQIVLAQAMTSSEKMDWIVQKATELGATEVQPVQTQRSVAKLSQERAEKRTEHWRGVVVAACEQSGRNDLMQVHPPLELSHWLANARSAGGGKFILLPDGAVALHAQHKPQGPVTLLIGPEGGFSPDEALMAKQSGFVPVLLGPRVLRTETAALAGISALQTLWGDFL